MVSFILLCSKQVAIPLCKEGHDIQSYYQPLVSCISGTSSKRWIPIQNRSAGSQLSSAELEVHGKYYFIKIWFSSYHYFFGVTVVCPSNCFFNFYASLDLLVPFYSIPHLFDNVVPIYWSTCIFAGVLPEHFFEDLQIWRSALKNYWSLLTPLIFSDHPKRPGDEDPLPPFNMIRNVMDMNSHYGGLNAAFLEEKKSVWVMNVVPIRARNTLPVILDQGFAGVLHDW